MADILVNADVRNDSHRVGKRHEVWTTPNIGYIFFTDGTGQDLEYVKTIDAGLTWTATPIAIAVGLVLSFDVWFDKWTPLDTGTKIHIIYIEADGLDWAYKSLNVSGDTLSAAVVLTSPTDMGLTTSLAKQQTTITKTRGGNLLAQYWDNETTYESFFYRSTDGGTSFGARATGMDANGIDHILLFPANLLDANDAWMLYWDKSANEISLKTYDNSGDVWTEGSIATSMVEDNSSYLQMDGAIRHTDGHLIVVAWSEVDTATADLRCYDVTNESTVTAKTNILTDTIEAAQCSILINQRNDDIYVAYIKGTAWLSLVGIHYKLSTDGGTIWGTETAVSVDTEDDHRGVAAGQSVGDDGGRFMPVWFNDDLNDLLVNSTNSVEIAAAPSGGPGPGGSLIGSHIGPQLGPKLG